MRRESRNKPILLGALALCLILAIAGCAHDKKAKESEKFLEKWKTIAAQSEGHSPSFKPHTYEPLVPAEVDKAVIAEKELPTKVVSLRMHDANIVAVLQALGRIAGQSIIVSPNVSGSVNVNIVNQPWNEIFKSIVKTNGLAYEWEGDILRVMTPEDLETSIKLNALRNRQPLATTVLNIRYAEAASLQEYLGKMLTQDGEGKARGTVEVDTQANALVVQAIPEDVRRIVKLVEHLDRPSRQIKLKAHIVETTSDTARELGIQWGGGFKSDGMGGYNNNMWVVPGGTGGTVGTDPVQGGGTTPTLNNNNNGLSGHGMVSSFIPKTFPKDGSGLSLGLMFGKIGGNILEAQLAALESDDKLRILSSPSITTLDNQTAFTENGAEVPYISLDEAGNADVEWKDAVLRLEITPHVIDSDVMKLKIKVKKDEVDLTRNVQGNPYIIKKQTETTLVTRDGETVVISGLTKHRASTGDTGIPGLKDVAGVGKLFSSDSKSNSLEEVLIFITPSILSEWSDGTPTKNIEQLEKEYDEKTDDENGDQ
ncbi:type IV pilus assembly protein PilQ [Desulfobaculum xiamenense]|uniref:Type IV pilus assembly protein PilQ n=1 Tax=Desulfobaculum xiamenense TaxID=995050 RepID=A0A846QQE8_9BACT|nr:type IV pilus secretin PilQ [Desulfobaculum xiamenense]NJB68573.1 type IV pilus assembly protein PilQ [Desulfobaculum xiamenense]